MITAYRKLWKRLRDPSRRKAFARQHVGDFLALQIFKMRKDRGLSQKALADMIGSNQPQIANWEGSCEGISLNSLHRIADAFDVTLSVKFVPYSDLVQDALVESASKPVPSFLEDDGISGARTTTTAGSLPKLRIEPQWPSSPERGGYFFRRDVESATQMVIAQ